MGDRLAQVLLDSIRADRDVVTGRTSVLTMVPGATFSIEGHPYGPMNQEYLVVAVELEGEDQPVRGKDEAAASEGKGYGACRFRAIPTSVAYRPPRIVREHFVSGVQTAITTGPSGEEIYTDAGGHVKVQFYWDRLARTTTSRACGCARASCPPAARCCCRA